MKILYIQSNFGQGGINRITSIKENYLQEHGFEVHNLNVLDDDNPTFRQLYNCGITMHSIPSKRLEKLYAVPIIGRILRFIYSRFSILWYLSTINPHIIVVNMLGLEPPLVLWLTFWKKRILEFHGWFNGRSESELRKNEIKAFKTIFPFYNIIGLTEREALHIQNLSGKQVSYIPNPLGKIPTNYSDCSAKRVISMARFAPQKNLDALLPFWKIIEDTHPEWELHLYGEGPDETAMRAVISEFKLSSVYLHPYTTDTDYALANSSIYILPSLYEGFPLVLLESMASGVPCVAYDCPCGPAEIIKDGEDGFVTEYNNPQALIDKVLFLIEHDDIRKKMGKKARENILRYNIDEIMGKWIYLFESLNKK